MSVILERYRVPIVGVLSVLLVVAGAVIYLRRPKSQPVEIVEPSPTPVPSPAEVAVYVTGAVLEPGVYYLPEECRVQDALEAAGGPTANADLDRVNLAQRVRDEDQIYFPEVGEENLPSTSASGSGEGQININTASAHELEELSGIGPALAQCIIDHRETHGPFSTIEEIMEVRGIGPGVFEDIRELITVW
ncbi:MAG TPA: helix-hairpin-helix domain-containing protein [Anaerolineae bacterium]|nr:helix-hairpin-helix domain-containing protein [Anaerolineae bacterium]HUW95348.1 helix-hairpin-helix domain-containing protein [Anaerolineae bacterium]